MKRSIGLSLLAVSVVAVPAIAYWLWIKAAFVADPLHHASGVRSYWLLAGVLLACAGNVFLLGLFLCRANGLDRTGGTTSDQPRRVFALPVYLVTSVNVGLLASHAEITRSDVTGLAWYSVSAIDPHAVLRRPHEVARQQSHDGSYRDGSLLPVLLYSLFLLAL